MLLPPAPAALTATPVPSAPVTTKGHLRALTPKLTRREASHKKFIEAALRASS
jgi:hypothetical protein